MMAVRTALTGAAVLTALILGPARAAASPPQTAHTTGTAGSASATPASGAATPSALLPPDPPWLGVGIQDGLRGVHINEVIDGTPADDAGIQPGDEVLSVAGVRVMTVQALKTTLTGHQVAETVTVEVWRRGRVESLPVVLAGKLSDSEILYRRLVGRSAPDFALPGVDSIARLSPRSRVRSRFGSRFGNSRITGPISASSEDHSTVDGEIAGLGGDVMVIYFFETDCRDCNTLHRPLSRLADARRRDGCRVVAVSRQSDEALQHWTREFSPSFPVLRDSYGEMGRSFRIEQLPALVVIDRRGTVVYAGTGGEDNLEHAIFATERALVSERHGWAR